MIYVGIALLVVTAVLAFIRVRQVRSLREVKATETSTVDDLRRLADGVAEEVGEPNRFHQYSEVKGIARCDAPLSAELSGQKAVYYKSEVIREYEESYWEHDSKTGRNERRTRRGSETLASNERSVDFQVEDVTGRLLVIPSGASFETVKSVDRFESGAPNAGASITLGSFTLDLGEVFSLSSSGRRTLGFRYREGIVPVDARVYILGEASTESGALAIQTPGEKGRRFLVSVRSEEEIVRSAENAIRWLTFGSVSCGALGVVIFILGFINR